jgi:hypothetical protein
MNLKMKEKLEKLAARRCWDEEDCEFNPMDQSGGNYDDAYNGGFDDGATDLARELLYEFFYEEELEGK